MIDLAHGVAVAQLVPSLGFVGMDNRAGFNARPDETDRIIFGLEHGRKRAAIALAQSDDNATLARLVDPQAAILAILFPVLGANVTARVHAVDFYRLAIAAHGRALHFGRHDFAQLVAQHPRGLGRDPHVARHLQRRRAFDRIDEQNDGRVE